MTRNIAEELAREARTPLPKSSPRLKLDKISKIYYTEWELDAQINQRLKILIIRELDRCGVLEENRSRILSEVFDDFSKQTEAPSLVPDVAPALYKERPDKSQSAEAFTNFHYSKYFGKGLTRADLKRLDKSLYGMLMKGGFPDSLKHKIPPAQGKGGGGHHGKGGSKPIFSAEELADRTRQQARDRMRRYRQRQSVS